VPIVTTTTPVRIDPRIRERLIAVRRQAGRKRLRIILVGCSLISAAGLAFLVVKSPFLDVDAINVSGSARVKPDAVRKAAGVQLHDPLLLVDAGAIARRVEELPWVANASVHRDFPGTVRIVVTEHQPAAYIRVDDGVLLVAPTGRIVTKVDDAPTGVFEVRGVRRAPRVGQLLSPPDAASVLGRVPLALAERVVAIDVADGLALDVENGGEIRLGNAEDLAAKTAAALAVLEHVNGAPFSYIDVSTPQRPIHRA
jgi:cell division protein FtsQ